LDLYLCKLLIICFLKLISYGTLFYFLLVLPSEQYYQLNYISICLLLKFLLDFMPDIQLVIYYMLVFIIW